MEASALKSIPAWALTWVALNPSNSDPIGDASIPSVVRRLTLT